LAHGGVRAERWVLRARRRSRHRRALQAASARNRSEEARGDAPPDPAAAPRARAVRPDVGVHLAQRDRPARGRRSPLEDRPLPLVGAARGRDAQEEVSGGERGKISRVFRSRSSGGFAAATSRGELGRGATPPPSYLAERVAQLAREDLDGPARAAGELELPLALGLEAPVAQPFAPGLDRLANRVQIERIAAELAGASHHVGCGPDEGAERGAGLDGVLATRPGGREGGRERLDVVQEEAFGPAP